MLRLPVSRGRFDLLQSNAEKMHRANLVLRRANDRLTAERDEVRRQYSDLLDKYHALRVAGANTPQPMAEVKPDRVVEAIKERANGNPRLERHLLREAAKLKLRQKSEDEIIAALTEWRDPSAEAETG